MVFGNPCDSVVRFPKRLQTIKPVSHCSTLCRTTGLLRHRELDKNEMFEPPSSLAHDSKVKPSYERFYEACQAQPNNMAQQ